MTLKSGIDGSVEDCTMSSGEKGPSTPDTSSTSKQPPKDLEAALNLLRNKDDTSRFVGLALLKPVLEQRLSHADALDEQQKSALIQRCWDAIPLGFLDRLLKAKQNDKRSKEEAHSMIGLAVAVLHAFMALLSDPENDKKILGRVPLLKPVLRSCQQETRAQIISIFHMIAMSKDGSTILFHDSKPSKSDEKPESYLFVTMLLIDIRSTIPSLQEQLHSTEYPGISDRLIKAYDITSAFIAFLIQSLEQAPIDDSTSFSAPMPIDLLLKLRTNISETLSLTIEHLRNRYDSSIAGAAGLHPTARNPNDPASTTPLPLAWESATGIFSDPLTLSQLRTLSLWLHDEENESLRSEAAGIMDVFLALYQYTNEQNFRSPVLIALQGVLETSEGTEAFLYEEGWMILADDLVKSLPDPTSHDRGIDIVRVLLAVAESDVAGTPQEVWMTIIPLAVQHMSACSELSIAVGQLAVELLTRSPRGIRRRCRNEGVKLLTTAEKLLMTDKPAADEDILQGLEEVVQGLEGLDLGEIDSR